MRCSDRAAWMSRTFVRGEVDRDNVDVLLEPCQLPSSGDARAPVSIFMGTTNRIGECCYLPSVLVTAVIAVVALAQPA
jgi:hypothetical protein